ncbi:MAG: filamentous hemagglutinin N-terminal domain-containing protein [Elainellaceae cyanobacterium]
MRYNGWALRQCLKITVSLCCIGSPPGDRALAQIRPDDTLGSERSIVQVGNLSSFEIDGGAIRANNLFHSFEEFNVPNRGQAYFNNPLGIERIFSRVTGTSASNIRGTLGVRGNADLFLINPQGIIFGTNARLDVRGSFVGTTANAVQFGDLGEFSASEPTEAGLLTIDPSALMFNQMMGGSIENRSVLGLNGSMGGSFILASGTVSFDRGRVNSFDGRVELGGITEDGIIRLSSQSDRLQLQYPTGIRRGTITLDNQSLIFLAGGDVVITGDRVTITNGSSIQNLGIIDATDGSHETRIHARQFRLEESGQIRATSTRQGTRSEVSVQSLEAVILSGGSIITSPPPAAGRGGGDIAIQSPSLVLQAGATIAASTTSSAQGGNISLMADSIELVGTSANGLIPTTIQSESQDIGLSGDLGSGGNVTISAQSLTLREGASISTATSSQGRGGNITIQADRVNIIGASDNGLFASSLRSGPRSFGTRVGTGGDIIIAAQVLNIRDGGIISASTFATGRGGNISIRGDEVRVIGISSEGRFFSAIASETGGMGEIGDAGGVEIFANRLIIRDGARVSTATDSIGNGGAITIQGDEISLTDANINASTFNTGNAGRITLRASDRIDLLRSRISTEVAPQAAGVAGSINIRGDSLELDLAQVTSETSGTGNAGSISVRGNTLTLRNNSSISTTVREGASATQPSNILLQGRSLSLMNGSAITASTAGNGDAGTITTRQFGTIQLSDSTLSTAVEAPAIGDGGQLFLQADRIDLSNNARVSASTAGQGRAGAVEALATTFTVRRGGQIETFTTGRANAGDIIINVQDELFLTDPNTGLFANTTEGSSGNGGNIVIDPMVVVVQNGAAIAVNSSGTGQGGDIQLAAGRLILDRGTVTAETISTQGGNIALALDDLLILRNGSQISAEAGRNQFGGDGGNVSISADFVIAETNQDNDIIANAFEGAGGTIQITAQEIFGIAERTATEGNSTNDLDASSEFGTEGQIIIEDLGIDPVQAATELPNETANPQLAQGCSTNGSQTSGRFTNIRRGGLAPNPTEPLSSDTIWEDLQVVEQREEKDENANFRDNMRDNPGAIAQPSDQIVEVDGWHTNADGDVVLFAASSNMPQDSCVMR